MAITGLPDDAPVAGFPAWTRDVAAALAPEGVWQDYTPVLANIAGTAKGRWTRIGDTIIVQAKVTLSAAPSNYFSMGLPVAASTGVVTVNDDPIGDVNARISGPSRRAVGNVALLQANTVRFISPGTDDTGTVWGTVTPGWLAAGAVIGFNATYEAAKP